MPSNQQMMSTAFAPSQSHIRPSSSEKHWHTETGRNKAMASSSDTQSIVYKQPAWQQNIAYGPSCQRD
ncbi:hypothetical protein J7T55_005729 [Diaporthe amygdali]|uniref:uncharacterized protein n=1 Tax=Phomopsis amygdali TaxID=1214568 RepID=UPI0022FDBA26|nr:uncharacterized protein J7T55_005729 [Diaporthe amygdali]KAJ0124391.1 hypothetical protein J7T55_005729 [Diaporthe amygdali]